MLHTECSISYAKARDSIFWTTLEIRYSTFKEPLVSKKNLNFIRCLHSRVVQINQLLQSSLVLRYRQNIWHCVCYLFFPIVIYSKNNPNQKLFSSIRLLVFQFCIRTSIVLHLLLFSPLLVSEQILCDRAFYRAQFLLHWLGFGLWLLTISKILKGWNNRDNWPCLFSTTAA